MTEQVSQHAERDERRIYHAQMITYLSVLPTIMLLASAVTAATLGDRTARELFRDSPVAFGVTVVTAALFVLAGWLLGRRKRAGAGLAVVLFGWMLVSSLQAAKPSLLGCAYAVAGVLLVARAWSALLGPARLAA